MKVIFVGVHNKVGKKPLCSSTKSGKLIDRIIKGLGSCWSGDGWWLKANLYNLEYLPDTIEQKEKEALRFFYRTPSSDEDAENPNVYVLLGSEVAKNFCNKGACSVVEIHHPASKRSHNDMDEYVLDAIEKINAKLKVIN